MQLAALDWLAIVAYFALGLVMWRQGGHEAATSNWTRSKYARISSKVRLLRSVAFRIASGVVL